MRLEAGNHIFERNRRISVNELSVENLEKKLGARLLNECYLAAKAALRRSEESIKKLERIQEEIIKIEDIEFYLQRNREFHFTIYNEAGASVIVDIIRPLWERVYLYLHLLFRKDPTWNDRKWIRNHQQMLEGMKKKFAKQVSKWVKRDLTIAAQTVIHMLKV